MTSKFDFLTFPTLDTDRLILRQVHLADAEDVFAAAAGASGFPVTTLRLPMVASEMDERGRIQCYIARLLDRAPILLPDEPGLPLRHVYAKDVARLVTGLVSRDIPNGRAYNISFGESMSLDEFVQLLASIIGVDAPVRKMPRGELDAARLLPHCSPFSGKWMSELDNSRSVDELGAKYTAPEEYLRALVEDYRNRWTRLDVVPAGLSQRRDEVLAIYPER